MRTPLLIRGCGMTTAVGLTAPASCAAIRARIDGFRETRFMAMGGTWIVGAAVPLEEPWRGLARLARLVAGPIRECLDAVPDVAPENIPLLLGTPEQHRPGRLTGLDQELLSRLELLLGVQFNREASRLIAMGRVAGAIGVREAARLVNSERYQHVIVAGVDSYLIASTIAAFDEHDRLLTERNSNGFIPGEAGSAVLIGADDGALGLRIRSLGQAVEDAPIESDKLLRGDGLAEAYKQALDAAGLGLHQIDYRIADLTGEQVLVQGGRISRGADYAGAVGVPGPLASLRLRWRDWRGGDALFARRGILGSVQGIRARSSGTGAGGRRSWSAHRYGS